MCKWFLRNVNSNMFIVLKKIFVKKKIWRFVCCFCIECVWDGVSGRGVIVRNGFKYGM